MRVLDVRNAENGDSTATQPETTAPAATVTSCPAWSPATWP